MTDKDMEKEMSEDRKERFLETDETRARIVEHAAKFDADGNLIKDDKEEK